MLQCGGSKYFISGKFSNSLIQGEVSGTCELSNIPNSCGREPKDLRIFGGGVRSDRRVRVMFYFTFFFLKVANRKMSLFKGGFNVWGMKLV